MPPAGCIHIPSPVLSGETLPMQSPAQVLPTSRRCKPVSHNDARLPVCHAVRLVYVPSPYGVCSLYLVRRVFQFVPKMIP